MFLKSAKLLIASSLFFSGYAQLKTDPLYFKYPLSITPKLNANFGEMRPNHFHMGLDISTESRENLPLYAPADGYVSRIKIEQGGFGNALYISHPNGLTTLYAHLNRFTTAVQHYLRAKQYELESWKVDIVVPEEAIQVQKGQLIGYTGNTGASQGPHLHFEVRDSRTENCYNPLRFDLSINDAIAPSIYKLAFYDRDKSVYEQSPIVVPLVKNGKIYKPLSDITLPYKKVFIAIHADDRINGAANRYGIFKAALYDQEELVTSFEMENIGYDKTRYLNGHIDYFRKLMGGPYYQMLFPSMGFGADIYSPKPSVKFIEIGDSSKAYRIVVSDIFGNESTAGFNLKGNSSISAVKSNDINRIQPGTVNFYEDELVRFVFPEDAFYDAFNFNYKIAASADRGAVSFQIQATPENIPVQNYFDVSIKPDRSGVLLNPDRIIMKRTGRGRTEVKKARLEKEFYAASFRDFGSFQLIQDLEPPTIVSNVFSGKTVTGSTRITIDVADNNRVIKDFKARIDDKWVLFYPTGNRYYYYPDEHFPPGEHKLSVVVIDEAGNTAAKDWIIKR
jgi:hypothetical protein